MVGGCPFGFVCVCVNVVLGNQTVVCGSSKVHEGCGSGEKHLSYLGQTILPLACWLKMYS